MSDLVGTQIVGFFHAQAQLSKFIMRKPVPQTVYDSSNKLVQRSNYVNAKDAQEYFVKVSKLILVQKVLIKKKKTCK